MDTTSPWVAVIDDEEAIRRALLRLLRSAGISARAFASGTELLDVLHFDPPYCIVLDLHMPGLSGLDLFARLNVELPLTSVIIMTGHHSPEAYGRAMLGHPIAYLQKPMNDDTLLDALAQALDAWETI